MNYADFDKKELLRLLDLLFPKQNRGSGNRMTAAAVRIVALEILVNGETVNYNEVAKRLGVTRALVSFHVLEMADSTGLKPPRRYIHNRGAKNKTKREAAIIECRKRHTKPDGSLSRHDLARRWGMPYTSSIKRIKKIRLAPENPDQFPKFYKLSEVEKCERQHELTEQEAWEQFEKDKADDALTPAK
jgi:transposase